MKAWKRNVCIWKQTSFIFSTWVTILKGYKIQETFQVVEYNFDVSSFLLNNIHDIVNCLWFYDVCKYLPSLVCHAFLKKCSIHQHSTNSLFLKPLRLCLVGYVYFQIWQISSACWLLHMFGCVRRETAARTYLTRFCPYLMYIYKLTIPFWTCATVHIQNQMN